MKRTVIAALISLAIPLLCLAQQTNTPAGPNPGKPPVMVTRTFDVSPPLSGGPDEETWQYRAIGQDTQHQTAWKEYFHELGVEWPEGSSIKYSRVLDKLHVTNTEENMRKVEDILIASCVIPRQIEIEAQFVEYKRADIDSLAKQGGVKQQELMNLWQKGEAELLYAPKVVTQSGVESTVKSVVEVIYPTQFTMDFPPAVGTNMNVNINSTAVLPGGFETREVGVILKVTPEVNNEEINLTMAPQIVEQPTWRLHKCTFLDKDGKQQSVEIEQPFFLAQTFITSFSVKNGATVMAGGGMMNRTNDKMVYCFVTARLIDTEGKPIRTPDSTDSESEKSGNK